MRATKGETLSDDAVRVVGGELVAATVQIGGAVQVEVLRRRTGQSLHWEFRQSRAALLWLRSGVTDLDLHVGEERVCVALSRRTDLVLVPAAVPVHGRFTTVGGHSDYLLVFIDESALARDGTRLLTRALVGFGDPGIQRGLARLAAEATNPDPHFAMYAEGWALQTAACLARLGATSTEPPVYRGGLSRGNVRLVERLVADGLNEPLTVAGLAQACGLSPRHFLRAFRESLGSTPRQYVLDVRLDRARQLLAGSDRDVASVALACGFSHSQHFSNRFRQQTGLTPSQYRRTVRT